MLVKGACALPRQCAVRVAGSAHRAACAAAARSASSCLPGRRKAPPMRRSPFGAAAQKVSRPCRAYGALPGRSRRVRRSRCFVGGATPRRPPVGPPPCAGAGRPRRPPPRPASVVGGLAAGGERNRLPDKGGRGCGLSAVGFRWPCPWRGRSVVGFRGPHVWQSVTIGARTDRAAPSALPWRAAARRRRRAQGAPTTRR